MNNKRKKLQVFIYLVLIIINIFLLFNSLELNLKQEKRITKKVDSINILDKKEQNYLSVYKETYNNNDIKALISIEDTNINEVVLQSNDNDYYLTHNAYGEYDKYGTIFMDYRNNIASSKKILIFGHSSSYKTTTFGELENYYSKDYYDNHKYIKLTTENEIINYEIFSVYIEVSDFDYMNLNFENNSLWYNHLLKLKNNSIYDTNVEINPDDEILILQTCSNNSNYQKYDKKFLLIIAKKIS